MEFCEVIPCKEILDNIWGKKIMLKYWDFYLKEVHLHSKQDFGHFKSKQKLDLTGWENKRLTFVSAAKLVRIVFTCYKDLQGLHLEQNNSMQQWRLRGSCLSSSFGAEPVTPGGQQTQHNSVSCHLQHWKTRGYWDELSKAQQWDEGKWLLSFIWHSKTAAEVPNPELSPSRQLMIWRETSGAPSKQ